MMQRFMQGPASCLIFSHAGLVRQAQHSLPVLQLHIFSETV